MTTRQHRLALSAGVIEAARDRLIHRGPDDAGVWVGPHAALGHRRLAILDPSPAGRQPLRAIHDGPVLVYNGELYNDLALRQSLRDRGIAWSSSCDTETLWHMLHAMGRDAPGYLRGMYAFAWYDEDCLLLARDPLGIKPLYLWEGHAGGVPIVAFASEIHALFAHPDIHPRPDAVGVSAYLTNIRTVTGPRTLFAGVRSLLPGEVVEYDLTGRAPIASFRQLTEPNVTESSDDFMEIFEESVRLHLRSDVPVSAMLSGGLDSSAICAVARSHLNTLHTYCSGCPDAPAIDGIPQADDFPASSHVSRFLRTVHTEVPVSRESFEHNWTQMVHRLGVPLSTPNEVAIFEVCRSMREVGRVVALSGEGADEILGGYQGPMDAAAEHVRQGNIRPGQFQLHSVSWCPPDLKPLVLTEKFWRDAEQDCWLSTWYEETFQRCAEQASCGMAAHLMFHRVVNLTGLLGRLDSSSMLASVEGRTPFADRAVVGCAESLPMSMRYNPETHEQTKVILRRSFSDRLPAGVVGRPKASFPLPFQIWMSQAANSFDPHGWLGDWIRPEALLLVKSDPVANWRLAWPILNLSMWGQRWWS